MVFCEVMLGTDKLFESGDEVSEGRSLQVSVEVGLGKFFVGLLESGADGLVGSQTPVFDPDVHEDGDDVVTVRECAFALKFDFGVQF